MKKCTYVLPRVPIVCVVLGAVCLAYGFLYQVGIVPWLFPESWGRPLKHAPSTYLFGFLVAMVAVPLFGRLKVVITEAGIDYRGFLRSGSIEWNDFSAVKVYLGTSWIVVHHRNGKTLLSGQLKCKKGTRILPDLIVAVRQFAPNAVIL